MVSAEEQEIIDRLTANWIWIPNWVDSSAENTAGRIVIFRHQFKLSTTVNCFQLYCSAETRYKFYVNGVRVAVGPARSSQATWFYDTLDIAPYLQKGENELKFVVVRYFASKRAAMPFERTLLPGLTVFGSIKVGEDTIDVSSNKAWEAQLNNNILFPTGLVDDVFLHINERVSPATEYPVVKAELYNIKTLNGELAPWRLRPRSIPMPEQNRAVVNVVRHCESSIATHDWTSFFAKDKPIQLPGNSSHLVELQADVHSTAFLRWIFKANRSSQVKLNILYSEGYELEPRAYPFFRAKADRLDREKGVLVGPHDEVTLDLPGSQDVVYEPFWFRTFRIMKIEIIVGKNPVELILFEAMQTNYPLATKARWKEPNDLYSEKIWNVSVRTMRNCMFDGYSDCPFYEQLQYSGDSRSVGLFHYLLSGDDRLMRQTISTFAASVTFEGLTQSRFPSHVRQIIAGFSLYWVLQVCDHYLYFGDIKYTRSFLPRIDGVFEFFNSHIDELGLVGGLPRDVWQYVDWVTTWGATADHPDKGVPTSGRKTNRHTYFSMLFAYVLKKAATLLRDVGRPGHADEYDTIAASLVQAIRKHCYDGRFFTDSTADIADDLAYSQHCQVFAVLSGAASPSESARLLTESFADTRFSKCSYVMIFYALRAFAISGDELYESYWPKVWQPWRQMLTNNLTTWEEDDVRQRSDCHAWGSVPIYEYCTELAGVQVIAPGAQKILFRPRLKLSREIEVKIALGRDNVATVVWKTGKDGVKQVQLHVEKAIEVDTRLPGGEIKEHGVVASVDLTYHG